MSFRKLNVDDTPQQLSEPLSNLSLEEHQQQMDQRATQVRALITRGQSTEALEQALENPPYGTGLSSTSAQLVSEVLMACRSQDIQQVLGGLSEEGKDTLLKYIYHGLGKPADFNCGVLLMWHERVVGMGGLGSIVRVMTDRKVV